MRIFSEGWSNDKDGPGQRLILYLKGCNMRCPWCANPESVSPLKQILFHPERASGPLDRACPKGAVKGGSLDRGRCASCESFDCVSKLSHLSFELAGLDVTPEWILEKAIASRGLFGREGGVTFGGGEPTLQADELLKTLALLKAEGISSAIESNASTDAFMKVAKAVDFVICDLKSADPERHLQFTGIPNARALDNLRKAASSLPWLLIRVPLVTGFNDDQASLDWTVSFLSSLRALRQESLKLPLRVEVLRMHHMGSPKRKALGEAYPMEGVAEPSQELLAQIKRRLDEAGVESVST